MADEYLNSSRQPLEVSLLVDNMFITISAAPKASFIEVLWKGIVDAKDYRHGMEAFVQYTRESGARFVLIDYSRMSVPPLSEQTWAGKHVMPNLRKASVTRLARLLSSDVFQSIAMDNIFRKAQPLPYTSKNFTHRDTAISWLFSPDLTRS